jgi:hypothetical protein
MTEDTSDLDDLNGSDRLLSPAGQRRMKPADLRSSMCNFGIIGALTRSLTDTGLIDVSAEHLELNRVFQVPGFSGMD